MVELKGVSEDQIRWAERWNREQIFGCCLVALQVHEGDGRPSLSEKMI